MKRKELQEQREKCHADPSGGCWQGDVEAQLSGQSSAASSLLLFKGSWLRSRQHTSGLRTQSPHSGRVGRCLRCRPTHTAESTILLMAGETDGWRDTEGVEAGFESGAGGEEGLGGMLASKR